LAREVKENSYEGRSSMHEPRQSDKRAQVAISDFTAMLQELTRPQAFPFVLPNGSSVALIQTHASAVLLTPDRVYKLKKPQDFGFFDYSTPALRRHFCQQEVLLNRPLAPHIYLGVAPVLAFLEGHYRFGPIVPPEEAPLPESTFADGTVVDYAVVMVRLPDAALLETWVQTGKADLPLLGEIARFVANFHATTHTDEHITSFGNLDVIRGNWEENFAQMQPYIGRTLNKAIYDHIVAYVHSFLEARTALFDSRVREGRIRDCHGDLRLQHVYILDHTQRSPHSGRQFAILDRIEFNERFRYSDVAGEIAFLAMELDLASRSDLARSFVDAYSAETGDETLRELLPFYLCYRACVRGKVLSFQLDEPEISEVQCEVSGQQASVLFSLAAHYASGPTRSILVMIGGLMGTGKSTVAHVLQRESGWVLRSSDSLRKRLAQLDPEQPQADAFGWGVYRPEWTARTYQALRTEAGAALATGRSVLLDASFMRRTDRQMIACEARAHGAAVLFVECVCPRETALQRLAHRWNARAGAGQPLTNMASLASDGRPDLYEKQSTMWEAFASSEEPDVQHIVLTTTQPVSHSCEQVLDVLGMPRLLCWLEREVR
jgi:aminoglycoside phosphotransferase family enzyme/predicted kinase